MEKVYTKWNGQYGNQCIQGYWLGNQRGIESLKGNMVEGDEGFEEAWNKLKDIADYIYRKARYA